MLLGPRLPWLGFVLLVVLLFTAITQSLELSSRSRDFSSLPDIHQKSVAGLQCPPAPEKHLSLTLKPHRRASNDQDKPRDPPKGKKPKFPTLKDDAAKKKLPYTAKLIKAANKKHGDSDNKPKRRFSGKYNDELDLGHLSKRGPHDLKDLLAILHMDALVKVGTDASNGIIYDWGKDIRKQRISTADLSGCTVLVVASPFAVIMVHIWERRDNSHDGMGWALDPESDEQKRQDVHFIAKASELLSALLARSYGSVKNGFNGWFPADRTTIQVVAPAANPEYDRKGRGGTFGNPWYTYEGLGYRNPMRLIYRNAAERLVTLAEQMVIPGRHGQSFIQPYARRYSNDPNHGMDDKQYVILSPEEVDCNKYRLQMLYDDDKEVTILNMT